MDGFHVGVVEEEGGAAPAQQAYKKKSELSVEMIIAWVRGLEPYSFFQSVMRPEMHHARRLSCALAGIIDQTRQG